MGGAQQCKGVGGEMVGISGQPSHTQGMCAVRAERVSCISAAGVRSTANTRPGVGEGRLIKEPV